jgi:hypothetical protein
LITTFPETCAMASSKNSLCSFQKTTLIFEWIRQMHHLSPSGRNNRVWNEFGAIGANHLQANPCDPRATSRSSRRIFHPVFSARVFDG